MNLGGVAHERLPRHRVRRSRVTARVERTYAIGKALVGTGTSVDECDNAGADGRNLKEGPRRPPAARSIRKPVSLLELSFQAIAICSRRCGGQNQVRGRRRGSHAGRAGDRVRVGRVPAGTERAHAVGEGRGRREPRVREGSHAGSRARDLTEARGRSRRALDLESILVARIVVPGEIDLTRGRRGYGQVRTEPQAAEGWFARRRRPSRAESPTRLLARTR